MTTGPQSGNEVLFLFNKTLGEARSGIDIKSVLTELRRDLAIRKSPLRILRHIPGCFLEFASGSIHGSLMFTNTKAPTRVFDASLATQSSQMNEAQQALAHHHKSYLSVTVTNEGDVNDTASKMTVYEVLQRIGKSALVKLAPKAAVLVHWGPSGETFDAPEALARLAEKATFYSKKIASSVAMSSRARTPYTALPRPIDEVPQTPAATTHLRDRIMPRRQSNRPAAVAGRVVGQAVALADTSVGKIAAGLAIGIILQAGLGDIFLAEKAMAGQPEATGFIVAE